MSESVKIPTSPDEAALMVLLGTNYLLEHAPERLTPLERRAACAEQLAAAGTRIKHACYLDDDVLNRRAFTTVSCEALREMFAALAAYEATKEKS